MKSVICTGLQWRDAEDTGFAYIEVLDAHIVSVDRPPYRGVLGDEPSNTARCIFFRPTPVAMATKFGTKLAITRLA